ncbi:hypothetical protein NQ317_003847 [Molorchus minor]|uniref:Uncharacterized protein n=1 Tax=Molorchus minor TaxID=1323400 RepID=A0ABQ9ITN7_9CUCU|nr:hypothetical protein NQ317_003847 [Molorchus minor]
MRVAYLEVQDTKEDLVAFLIRKGKKGTEENNNIVADEGNKGNSHEDKTRSNDNNIAENYDAASEFSSEEEGQGGK